MFSQRDEEKYILEYFGDRKGRFLDIGAYNGKTFSNTHALALKGWGGVCYEPVAGHCDAMRLLYRNRPDILIHEVAVGLETATVPFWKSPDAVSTTDKDHAEKWKETGRFEETEVNQISIFDIIQFHCEDFDFVNIDTEGTSMAILEAMPIYPEMICVENDGASLQPYAEKNGYRILHQTCENTILVRE